MALRSGAGWAVALVAVGLGGCLGSSDPADHRGAASPDTSHQAAVLTVHESAAALPVAIPLPVPDTSGIYITVAPDSGVARTDSLFHFEITVHNDSTEPVVLFGLRDDDGIYNGVREWEEGQGVCRSDRLGVSYVLFDAHGEEYTRTMSLGDNDIDFYTGLFGGANPDSLLEAQVDRITREHDEERAAPPPVAWNDRVVVAPGGTHSESWAFQVAVGYGLGGESAPYSFVVYYRMGEEAAERGEEDALLGCYVANPIRLRVDSSWGG